MRKAFWGFCFALLLLAPGSGRAEEKQRGVLDRVKPFHSYGHVYDSDNFESMRPRVMGRQGVVASGHYLATLAGIEALKKGGNAFDAGVTAAMALKVTKMDFAGWNGVAPLILYSARDGEVITRNGAGTSPGGATLAYFLEHEKDEINTALVPADVDVWLAALDRYGKFSFAEAVAPALQIAENGYHLYKMQKGLLDSQADLILRYPYNVQFWFPQGVGRQKLGDLMRNSDLGKLIRYMMAAEEKTLAAGGSRSGGIRAARDAFYKGEPARAVERLYREQGGLMTYQDLAAYEGKWMAPLHTRFMGYDVYTCDGWSQGPRLILFLNALENFDLKSLGYNTPEYIHLISQVVALGMSDSYKYVGDPDFAPAPKGLYSKEYGRERAKLVDLKRAFADMPPWGDPTRTLGIAPDSPRTFITREDLKAVRAKPTTASGRPPQDTTSLNVMDGEGNVFSMTESDGHMTSPMVPGWGFGLSDRMGQFDVDPGVANVMAPQKRPRNTNSPFLVMKDGKPLLGLSTPGGDQQAQVLLQVFLNIVLWGMSPEQALDQPRFGSYNFPETGAAINKNPARLSLEQRIPPETAEALRKLGHDVRSWGLWNWLAGAPTVTYRDPESGLLIGAGDVRRETSALGY
jgi:gamma-glutamyltranspeptidase/glutathione hydrolase